MPSESSVRSSVVPEGTTSESSTIVAQDVLDALAEAAPSEPLKVHDVLRLVSIRAKSGAAVGRGAGAGAATAVVAAARKAATRRYCILKLGLEREIWF